MSRIIYLDKSNQPSRITSRKFAAYKRAKREGLSANEGYNTSVYGISSLEYAWIREAVRSTCGICEEMASLSLINKWFASPSYLVDMQGRYLDYFGNPRSVHV